MLQHLNQAASCLRSLRIDEADNRLFQIVFVNFTQIIHCIRLCIVQEFKEHLTIHGIIAVKICSLTDYKTIVLLQSL